MQWDESWNAGFTTGIPWIGLNPNYHEINAEKQVTDSNSIFSYYKRLIELRKQHEIIVYGTYNLLLPEHPTIYAYTRILANEKLLVVLNFSKEQSLFELPEGFTYETQELVISNYDVNRNESIEKIELKPYEARVYRLTI